MWSHHFYRSKISKTTKKVGKEWSSPLKFLIPFDLLVPPVPVFMVYLRSIKTVFLCDPFYLWLVQPNKKSPVGFHLCFNPFWSTLVVSALKILFFFSKIVWNFIPTDVFMCSYDVCSLYTSIPLEETIEICCDVLFRSSLPKPAFPESVFKHLMNFATSSVEFSFNNIMYW